MIRTTTADHITFVNEGSAGIQYSFLRMYAVPDGFEVHINRGAAVFSLEAMQKLLTAPQSPAYEGVTLTDEHGEEALTIVNGLDVIQFHPIREHYGHRQTLYLWLDTFRLLADWLQEHGVEVPLLDDPHSK